MEQKNIRWQFYNHALIPICPEYDIFEENLSYSRIVNECKEKINEKKIPLFCLYPTNFDCEKEMPWWYNIKDCEYEIGALSSKKRYEIKKGNKNFKVELINPQNYINEIFDVYEKSFSAYPEKYRPVVNYESIKENIATSTDKWFGAFCNETDKLCGFIIARKIFEVENKTVMGLAVQKTDPAYEKKNINFALLDRFLNYYNIDLKEKKLVITNGQRNIRHETQFNEFLVKYFGFRRAYSKLNIKFHPLISPIVKLLYICTPPHWKNTEFKTDNRFLYKISLILKYMKIEKECKKQCKIKNK